MSKNKNGGLHQYGDEPFEQQQFGTAGVEGVNVLQIYLHPHGLFLDRLLMFITAFSTLALKPPFLKVFHSIAIYPFLRQILGILSPVVLAVTGAVTLVTAAD